MSKFPEYDSTAGFPKEHVAAFLEVACNNRMMISSRELNPLCTDLMLEGYAAKGFHIKAKTCDWGPMAGFVPEDYRFTKAKQDTEKQKQSIGDAFGHHAQCAPLYISKKRLISLQHHGMLKVLSRPLPTLLSDGGHKSLLVVAANPEGGSEHKFTLVLDNKVPPGFKEAVWGVYYHAESLPRPQASAHRIIKPGVFPRGEGLEPVYGMTNPHSASDEDLGGRAAVCGDYDLWCIFEHSTVPQTKRGVSDRNMPVGATLVHKPSAFIQQQAAAGGLVFSSPGQKNQLASQLEDEHLGNISQVVNKIRNELNQKCNCGGGNVVQHSDYGGNPYGDIDYPIIFFIPTPPDFQSGECQVAKELAGLREILKAIQKKKYVLKLNPQWGITLF
jgi:Anthrax toxin LF subunit